MVPPGPNTSKYLDPPVRVVQDSTEGLDPLWNKWNSMGSKYFEVLGLPQSKHFKIAISIEVFGPPLKYVNQQWFRSSLALSTSKI